MIISIGSPRETHDYRDFKTLTAGFNLIAREGGKRGAFSATRPRTHICAWCVVCGMLCCLQ